MKRMKKTGEGKKEDEEASNEPNYRFSVLFSRVSFYTEGRNDQDEGSDAKKSTRKDKNEEENKQMMPIHANNNIVALFFHPLHPHPFASPLQT